MDEVDDLARLELLVRRGRDLRVLAIDQADYGIGSARPQQGLLVPDVMIDVVAAELGANQDRRQDYAGLHRLPGQRRTRHTFVDEVDQLEHNERRKEVEERGNNASKCHHDQIALESRHRCLHQAVIFSSCLSGLVARPQSQKVMSNAFFHAHQPHLLNVERSASCVLDTRSVFVNRPQDMGHRDELACFTYLDEGGAPTEEELVAARGLVKDDFVLHNRVVGLGLSAPPLALMSLLLACWFLDGRQKRRGRFRRR